MASRLESCLVRIHSADGIVGAGFLVSENHVVTCAHVVTSALKCPADEIVNKRVILDFPLVEGVPKTSAVVQFSSCVEGHSESDIAGLKLCKGKALLNGSAPTRLVKLRGYRGRVVDLFGCPPDHPKGDWILDAVLSNPVHSSRVQLEIRGNLANPVRPGFSGGPVWDKNELAIVGMIVEANEKYGTGEMIPVTVLAETWDVVREVATVPVARLSNVPPRPTRFVPRPEYMKPLKAKLLGKSDKAVAVTATGSKKVGVQGMGGIGKTVLAAGAVRDKDVRRAYPDGVIWLTLGQQTKQADLVSRQAQLAEALGEPQRVFQDVQEGKARLEELLADKACLIVLDDVWKNEHAEAFDVLGGQCRMLITTRHKDVVAAMEAQELQLEILEDNQALVLLSKWAGISVRSLPAEAHEIVDECDGLPLALAMIGTMIQRRPERWENALRRLRDADLEKFRRAFPGYPYPNLFRAMAVSVDALEDQDKERYLDFAIFPEDTPIPEEAMQTLWQADGLSPYDVQSFLDLLEDRSLLRRDESGRLTLHDLQLDYVRKEVGDGLAARHRKLLHAYRQRCPDGWHNGLDDGYFFKYLAHHLCKAGLDDELRQLLFDYRWLARKLEVTAVNGLIADYDFLTDDSALRLVQGAIRLSAHILAQDKTQLAGQLSGRLLSQKDKRVKSLLAQAKTFEARPWLRPLRPSLGPPGGPFVRSLDTHAGPVTAVAVTSDGRLGISGTEYLLEVWDLHTGNRVRRLGEYARYIYAVAVTPDGRSVIAGVENELEVWDLQSGKRLHKLKGHRGPVFLVAVSAQGRFAISGSRDRTMKVWDLSDGKLVQRLECHARSARVAAMTPDGKLAVSGWPDGTFTVWNIQTGEEVHSFEDHAGSVTAVAITSDGRYAVSGAQSGTVRVRDVQSGKELHSFKGHARSVHSVVVSSDAQFALSVSQDATFEAWDLSTGKAVRIRGLGGWPTAMAVNSDGHVAVSGSSDGMLSIWDLQSPFMVQSIMDHGGSVNAVDISSDGRIAVSGSEDKTLKVWDLRSRQELYSLAGHAGSIYAVAVTSDGGLAVSGSEDETLKVWDLRSRQVLYSLEDHAASIYAVAVTSDGRFAVSGSGDRTLNVWNLQRGKKVRRLKAHERPVTAVAVTPDDDFVLSSDGWELKVWGLPSGNLVRSLGLYCASAIAITSDGRYAVLASGNVSALLDLQTGKEVRSVKGQEHDVNGAAVTADGRFGVYGSHDKTLKVWDLKSGEIVARFCGESTVECCAVAPDGITIVAGEKSGRVHFLRLENVR